MNVLVCFSEILFPSQLPMWVDQRDQLCLLFTCLGYVCASASVCFCVFMYVCVYTCVRVCAHVCVCVCVCRGWGGWSDGESSFSTLSCYTLCGGYCHPHHTALHPDLGNNLILQHLRVRVRAQIWDSYYLTIYALSILLWGILISTVHIWDLFPKGKLPADSRNKKLNIVCPLQKQSKKQKPSQTTKKLGTL